MIDEELLNILNGLKEQVLDIEENYIRRNDILDKFVPVEDLIQYPTKTEIEKTYLTISDEKRDIDSLKHMIESKMDNIDMSVYVLNDELNGYVPVEKLNEYLTKSEIEKTYFTVKEANSKISLIKSMLDTKMDNIDMSVYVLKDELDKLYNSVNDRISGLDFYTRGEVDKLINDIEITTDVDLSNYVQDSELEFYLLKTELDTILNSKGYITEHQSLDEYVKTDKLNKIIDEKLDEEFNSLKKFYDHKLDEIRRVYHKTIEKGGYVTKKDVIDSITESLVDYLTSEQLEQILGKKDYTTKQYISEYVRDYVNARFKENFLTKSDIEKFITKDEIPTNLSELKNDVGYITQHQSLSGYVKKSELSKYVTQDKLDEVIRIINIDDSDHLTKKDLVDYVKRTDIPTNLSELHNDVGYITKHQSLVDYVKKSDITGFVTTDELEKRLSEIQSEPEEVVVPEFDLSEYAKLYDIPTRTSQLFNDSGFFT